jgi:hypothetical protein
MRSVESESNNPSLEPFPYAIPVCAASPDFDCSLEAQNKTKKRNPMKSKIEISHEQVEICAGPLLSIEQIAQGTVLSLPGHPKKIASGQENQCVVAT